jgi:hypothetical protein
LTEAGANILGVVVNDIEVSSVSAFSPSVHHRYQYGYGYGTRGYGYRDDTTESTDEVEETENGKKDNQGAKSSSHVHERESDEFADDE